MCVKTIFIKNRLLTFLTIALIFSGCGQNTQKSAQNQQSVQSDEPQEKTPEQLKAIESNVEKIIFTLNGPAVTQKEVTSGNGGDQQSSPSEQSQKQKGGQDENNGQSQQGQKGGQQSQDSGQNQSQQSDPWEKLTPLINKMHYDWNSLMPLSVKNGANKTLIDNFGNALNSLTNSIISKNRINTLMAANHLYSFIPDCYALSKTKNLSEIKRVRYYTRNAVLNSMTANWEQADSDINSLKESWSLYKNTVPKEQQDTSNKLDFSIHEFEKVIKERNQPLSDIKGRVTMSNIEELEKAAAEKSGVQQSGGSGSQSAEG